MEKKTSKLIDRIAEAKIKLTRGIGLIAEIKNAIYVGAGLTIIFKLQILQSIIATVLAFIGFYIIGFLDIKYFKLLQAEQKLLTGKYNPYFKSKLGKIKK